jgi:hypothetical protein
METIKINYGYTNSKFRRFEYLLGNVAQKSDYKGFLYIKKIDADVVRSVVKANAFLINEMYEDYWVVSVPN